MSNIYQLNSTRSSFHHASQYASPDDVLAQRDLSIEEKRAILSSWASDMYAVESRPDLRLVSGHRRPVALAAILQALRSLDDSGDDPPRGALAMPVPAATETVEARGKPVPNEWLHAKRQSHLSNIRRYERLLRTELTDLERQFVQRRLAEEHRHLSALPVHAARRAMTAGAAC